ncbi:MAG: TetR/AcrR family transcriptional regulator [Candidatus Latescibacteria bacterium]|jgi:AcrR family transcriptional regulator|nr:TetR/AcrR family transcriptional regulator [Candidatus Latescibacterota bacterium]
MGIQERKARNKEDLRRQILDAARHLFVTEGYENVSMRKVADRIEYSPTTIYLHFRNKAELLGAISEETLQRLLNTLEGLSKEGGDAITILRKSAQSYVAFGLEHPKDYDLTFIKRPLYQEGLRLTEGSAGERAFRYLRAMVNECIEQKQFRPVDVETTGQALWGAMHGVTSLLISYPDFPWVDKNTLINTAIDIMIDGLKAQT